MPERYRALVVLAAGTGLRQGEAFAVEVEAVDWLRRTLRVDRQLVLLPGGEPYIAPPKTPASYRTVPFPQVVIDAPAAHLSAFPAAQVEVLDATHSKPDPKAAAGRAGVPLLDGPSAVANPVLRRLAARGSAVGLGDGVTFHDLRHYYASLLTRHGESVKVVQKRLGYKSAVETLDTYSHLWPDSEDRTREAVEAVLGRAVGGTGAEVAP
jgi:integrase